MPRLTEDMKKFIKENKEKSNRKLEELMSSNGKLGPSRTAIGNYKNTLIVGKPAKKVVSKVAKVVTTPIKTATKRHRSPSPTAKEDKQFMTGLFARFFAQRSTNQEDMVKAMSLVDTYFI